MLRLRINLADAAHGKEWSWDSGRWRAGSSYVEPFAHPGLTQLCVSRTELGTTRFVVAEKRANGDLTSVDIGGSRVRVTAGPVGVAPIYLATSGSTLHGSWEVTDLARFASPDRLVSRVIARALTGQIRYSIETPFADIQRVTERATAWFDRDGLSLKYPRHARHVLKARRLAPDADPVSAFGNQLNATVGELLDAHGDAVAVELSGGLDSGNVALSTAGRARDPLLSLGVLVHGATGQAQQARRRALISRFGLRDFTVNAADYLPFDMASRRFNAVHDGEGQIYYEMFEALRQHAASEGVHTVLTGFGGDEMLALRLRERRNPLSPVRRMPEWLGERVTETFRELDSGVAPASSVAVSVLMAATACNPNFLRAGLWPVAPLADPWMLRFGESLPVHLRKNKHLFRQRLARAGFSEAVTHPVKMESFGDTMALALTRHGPRLIADMLTESILIDHGYVDPDLLARQLDPSSPRRIPLALYDTLALEWGLRSMTSRARASVMP